MKPVDKGKAPRKYAQHGDAKPDLIAQIGQQCSYCEAPGSPQDLDVEHIYPQKPHPSRKTKWGNFLIACGTCNSYKNIHLGSGRRRGLEKRYLWPHLDNTFSAFSYIDDGRVEIEPTLSADVQKFANAIREMVGLMKRPDKANGYDELSISYDGISKRKEHWQMVLSFRPEYINDPSRVRARQIARRARRLGYFSIWMKAFQNYPDVRRALIIAFKADRQCFDANTLPLVKGRV